VTGSDAVRSSLRTGTTMMVVGTAFSAIEAYVFQVIGGRVLGPEGFAPVSVMWTVLFLGFTVFLLPLEQMVIRRRVLSPNSVGPFAGAPVSVIAIIGGASLLTTGFAVLARDSLLGGDAGFIPVAALMFVGHGVLALGRGHLAGSHRFAAYGTVVVLDAAAKLTGAVVVALMGWGPVALSWALVVSPIVVFAVRPFRAAPVREGSSEGVLGQDLRFVTAYVMATAASQTVLAAGPLVVGALGAASASISVFFVTTTLFRGPMSASYNLVARILPMATRRAASGDDRPLDRWVVRLLAGGLTAAVVVGLLGAVLGPWIVALLYGSEFRPDAWLAGLAAAGVLAGMAGLVTTQILVARGRTDRLAIVWLAVVALAALTIAVVPGEPAFRVVLAFCVAEAGALVGLSGAALIRSRATIPAQP
jgi:O-antigen/teichoic acid export membrane protein